MKQYLVTFKPLEPFFFGNDKIFSFTAQENGRYFISSENTPSQSTLLGAIRYILLPVKKTGWDYNTEENQKNIEAVGNAGFNPSEQHPDFGKIIDISPVFITGDNGAMVRTPFDHIVSESKYTPFSKYEFYELPDGRKKLYTQEYNSKEGVACSYMQLKDGAVIEMDKIFKSDIRVGINRNSDQDGFFKKEYKILLGNYSFAVYLTLDDSITPQNNIVQLGQGKSTFVVSFHPEENTLSEQLEKYLGDNVVYCMSDTFTESDIYDKSAFSVTGIKTYRHFLKNKNQVTKGNGLYNIIEAGSIFIPHAPGEFISQITEKPVNKAGYNNLVYKKEKIK